jgi:hypothetical protein
MVLFLQILGDFELSIGQNLVVVIEKFKINKQNDKYDSNQKN